MDFSQPERFDLHYADDSGGRMRPVVIHRAILGSVERFFALLTEHTAGAFPVWSAPTQASVIPISDSHAEHAAGVARRLREAGFRVELDERREKVGYKIRQAELRRIPFMVVIGDREQETGHLSLRTRGTKGQRTVALDEFLKELSELVRSRSVTP